MIDIFKSATKESDFTQNSIPITEQLRFFTPLAITTLFMYITLSLFNAGLARLPSPEIFISSYAVAQSFTFLFESFVIPVRQVMTAMVKDGDSYYKTKKFVKILSIFSILLFGLIIYSGLARLILRYILGVEGRILDESVIILRVLAVFPAIVAFRNFYQGMLMKFKITPLVTVGAIVRMIFVGSVILFIKYLTPIPGGIVAGSLLLGAVFVEGVAMFAGMKIMSIGISDRLDILQKNSVGTDGRDVNNKLLLSFTIPLILTTFIGTIATPIINMGLLRTVNPVIAISSFTVGWDLGMIFVSPLTMFHQIPLNYLKDDDQSGVNSIKKFTILLGSALTFVISIIAFTPAGHFLLRNYMGVSEEISIWSMDVLKVMSILPAITVTREFFWGILLRKHMTKYVVSGKVINLITLALSVATTTLVHPPNPAIIGAAGMIISQAVELVYLYWIVKGKGIMQYKKQASF